MEDFGVSQDKIGESAQRVVHRAIEEARRRDHAVLANEHVFLAFAQLEWESLAQAVGGLEVRRPDVLRAIHDHMQAIPTLGGDELRTAPATKRTFTLAFDHATRAGRQTIEASDLLLALFDEVDGVAASVFQDGSVPPEVIASRIATWMRDNEVRAERLRARFELPPFLKQFGTNLNLLARQDTVAPAYGRDREIQQVLEILCHRERSNSVMLIGEPGVGKTAIVEGLARRIEFEPDSVPVRLRNCQVVSLQMNAVVAGTMLRGMFEDRLQSVIREIKERPNLILFVDEAHTLIGAGSAMGAPSDAANIFKSALARGEIRMIAATTLSEHKEYIQEDEALARRFRTVHVAEPSVEDTRLILYNLRSRFERNYSVSMSDEAIETALEMAPRYQRHLHLPDKVLGWLDTAAVRTEIDRRWEVQPEDVVDAISRVSQVPRDMVFRNVGDRFKDIEARLGRRVIGQKKAVQALAHTLVLNKGPLKDGYDRPDGVLLFLGPTGVGKTELAKALAEFLFGDERKMVRVDMSEYQDGGVSVDKLIGMPRGIAGSDRGGILTNHLADMPCSVVLLDEIEKASPAVLNLFLQAFDEGWLTDGRGKRVYLSDAIIIMTSNAGSEHFRKQQSPMGFRSGQLPMEAIQSEINRDLERRFPPEFRNRIDQVVVFEPLTKEEVRAIALKIIERVQGTLTRFGKTLTVEPQALETLVVDGYSPAYGARFLKRVIDERIKVPISQRWSAGDSFTATVRDDRLVIEAVAQPLTARPDLAFADTVEPCRRVA